MLIPLGSLLRLKHDFSEMDFISKYREILGATVGGWRWEGGREKAQVLPERTAHTVGWLKPAGPVRLSKDPICNMASIPGLVLSTARPAALPGKEDSGTG